MSYTKLTDFAAKDALLSGNPSKLLRGTEIDAEFNSIESAMAAAEAVNITAPIIAASTSKTTPVDADVLPILDSAASYGLASMSWSAINASIGVIPTSRSNTKIGDAALYSNTTGFNNTASGQAALYSNTTGVANTASGVSALTSNTTGSYNTASGQNALQANTTGSGNTAINPLSSAGAYAPVFNPTTENNRICMGSTGVTNAYIQVAWTVVSDARDKTDFAPVPHGLDFVKKLKTTAYRYKMTRADTEGHGPVRYGFKAQEVLALEGNNPVIVDAEDAEKLRFNDQAMIAVLVNALQELNAKFDAYVSTHP